MARTWSPAPDQVDLVLQDDDVLQAHDLHGCQVLGRLRLGARLVRGDQQQRAVHHGRPVQHRRHQNVVPCMPLGFRALGFGFVVPCMQSSLLKSKSHPVGPRCTFVHIIAIRMLCPACSRRV